MKKIIPIESLTVGMYLISIAESETKMQVKSKGLIKSSATINTMQERGVLSVEIDVDKSDAEAVRDLVNEIAESTAQVQPPDIEQKTAKAASMLNFEAHQKSLAVADKLYTQARSIQGRFVTQLRSGAAPDFKELNKLTQDIIDSVFDNNQAIACLVMLKENSDYLVQHSLNCSILLSIFARHKGMSQSEVEDLTLAGLLMDIGMALLPPELTDNKGTYSEADKALMRTHVDIGLEVIERYSDLPSLVEHVIQHHHERIDGSGYPKGLTDVSLYAQMASIVDSYDAMLTERDYRMASNSQEALEKMQQSGEFDSVLIDEFIGAIGLYPVGTLIQLKSDKLAIVMQANDKNPLKPKVMAFYHVKNKHHIPIKIIDLKRSSDRIKVAVRPEEFDINLPKFFRTAIIPE